MDASIIDDVGEVFNVCPVDGKRLMGNTYIYVLLKQRKIWPSYCLYATLEKVQNF